LAVITGGGRTRRFAAGTDNKRRPILASQRIPVRLGVPVSRAVPVGLGFQQDQVGLAALGRQLVHFVLGYRGILGGRIVLSVQAYRVLEFRPFQVALAVRLFRALLAIRHLPLDPAVQAGLAFRLVLVARDVRLGQQVRVDRLDQELRVVPLGI